MTQSATKRPWLIRMHHRMRSLAFAMIFLATGLHVYAQDFGLVGWGLLGLLFLVYPHLQFWRACRADDPVRVEMQSLLIDSLLLGIYIAALAFPLWLAFSAALGTLSNAAANKDWKGVRQTILALSGGALLGGVTFGFRYLPDTEWPVTLFCIAGLTWYLLSMNNIGFSRNIQLRQTREELRLREQDLVATNLSLQRSLTEIDALQVQLREQASRDPLTRLYNRGYLDIMLDRELARCKREGEPLSVAMIDVDHFKDYNDHYGHQAGDECLKSVAHVLQENARRASDLVARYGGEEFLLILPNTDADAAQQLAETVRRGIESLAMPHPQSPPGRLTISLGVATMTSLSDKTVEGLLRAADEALYRAKGNGRNQVQLASEVLPPAEVGENDLAKYVQLVWHEAHACGNGVIDDQHRALFRHANNLLGSILSARPADELAAMLDALIGDVTQHFQDEEKIITAADLPGLAEHVAEHRELVARVEAMREEFRLGTLQMGELFQFVAVDLIARHMLAADKEFFHHLQGRG